MTILVTGATGTIGSEILRLLAEKETSGIRALVRDAQKVEQVVAHGVEPVIGTFEDSASLEAAMASVDTIMMITPAGATAVDQASRVIRAAKIAGVRKIVRVSAIKAATDGPTNNTRAHGETEAEIVQSGLQYVLLRPNLFMQNLFMGADQIKQQAQFSFATGNGKMGMIDARDIAACAVECTLSDQWDGQVFELTGPKTISYQDVATTLSELSGEQVEYLPMSPEDMFAMIDGAGWGEWMAALTRDYGRAYARGWGEFTTDAVQQITGTPPRSIGAFAEEVFLPATLRVPS
ncbi:SDR family oxidoreductase [Rhodobacteraceae bacterium B1Z28]|uniref:SDR family oxidoreductase n=1 Tax=Ruegeria haliotis TaxID=2747601 RepID=A0ABX2PS05_9RHOB|nr:SDR family oxidoreductase [Ruegeria haliotis]NVO56953.1 SDR family oxidoreductase [Ruegeria haliotis]